MIDWRARLKPGSSFRGVAFLIESAELTGGQRAPRHVYPGKRKTWSEPLGLEGHGLALEAILIGDDYLDQVEALVEALEAEGPGELLHPYFGTRTVIATSFTVRVRKEDGGLATIAISFEETDDEPTAPTAKVDTVAAMEATASAAVAAVGADLEELHNLEGIALGGVDRMADTLRDASKELKKFLRPLADGAQALAALEVKLEQLQQQAIELTREPAELLALLDDTFAALVPPDPVKAVASLLAAYRFDSTATRPGAATARQLQARATFDAIDATVRRYALINAAQTAVAASSSAAARSGTPHFPSYEDALRVRADVLEAIDEQLETASDTAYLALMQLRASLVRGVPGDDSELAHLVAYTPPVSLPSLVLSHELYGNLDGEADLIARNKVRNPAFVPGGAELEVLSRAS